ncbi:MAG: TRAP transporter small permease [Desulfuromonadaceae bacterium]|nr:TRAP transporter small permease [Desulfuromonadaceae bacterium]
MLKKAFRTIDKIFCLVEDWTLVSVVAVALTSGLVNIILRKTTSISLYWSDEVVRKAIFICTYIGCSAAIRQRALIRIDALPQIIPVTRKFFNVINHVAVLIFAAFLTRLGWSMTLTVYADEFATTATLQIPEWYFYAVLPLVGAMMFVRTLMLLIEDMFLPETGPEAPHFPQPTQDSETEEHTHG